MIVKNNTQMFRKSWEYFNWCELFVANLYHIRIRIRRKYERGLIIQENKVKWRNQGVAHHSLLIAWNIALIVSVYVL